jgi:hypothetical protein
VTPSQVRRSKLDFMTDVSLLSRPADATAADRTEPSARAGEPVVTVVADVARPSEISASGAHGLSWRSLALPWLLPFGLLLVWQSPRALDDVDAAATNTNYATQAGLDPVKDPILREDVNLIAVRAADKDKPWVKALVESYHSPEVKEFVLTKFNGAVLPSW